MLADEATDNDDTEGGACQEGVAAELREPRPHDDQQQHPRARLDGAEVELRPVGRARQPRPPVDLAQVRLEVVLLVLEELPARGRQRLQ